MCRNCVNSVIPTRIDSANEGGGGCKSPIDFWLRRIAKYQVFYYINFFIFKNKQTFKYSTVHAAGEFTVLNSPKAISFKGTDPLNSRDVGDVLYAAMGNAVVGDSDWSGLTINDPFNLAKGVIAVHVEGLSHVTTAGKSKTYELVGPNTGHSLNALAAELEAANEPVCDINFDQYDEGVSCC